MATYRHRGRSKRLADIRNHQVAVLQGIRAAFNSMLEHFDPERLREEFDGKRAAALRKMVAKRLPGSLCRDFRTLTRDPDEAFALVW